jgi:hypothetical protein
MLPEANGTETRVVETASSPAPALTIAYGWQIEHATARGGTSLHLTMSPQDERAFMLSTSATARKIR